ncbi:MAG: metallophosphoesterase [endosymbiont of Galathealinum brachiosum]|uniref:Metallophosphoesterase n=1 Tax=endosymbiont of Galathealinum brachiosum TaxID=2200906 RepID=A0A370DM28_9GAMM|nr:MAG: metallophosphoesterase [endosymbiont of Galathealinum brachiosum]
MKIHILSDLHNEFLRSGKFDPLHKWSGRLPETDTDIIVLAGDIDTGVHGVEWAISEAERLSKKIIYVSGNHEYYGHEFNHLKDKIQKLCEGTQVSCLDYGECIVDDVRFLGATLWTDYKAFTAIPKERVMLSIENVLADHRKIRFNSDGRYLKFKPHHALTQHNIELNWLKQKLSEPFKGKTVIVTHHGPHPVCQHPAFPVDELTAAFHSDLSSLIEMFDINLWIYGHTHANLDRVISDTRILSNQAGYPGENVVGFDVSLVVDV